MVLYILADLISFLEIQRLQLARSSSTVFAVNLNVYVPPPPNGEGHYPYRSPPFVGTWESPVGAKVQRKRTVTRKKEPTQLITRTSSQTPPPLATLLGNFVIKPLSNFDLFDWIKTRN